MNTEISYLLDSYYVWLKEKTSFEQKDDFIEITTPFLDRHNDYIQLYVKNLGGKLLLTDDGYTIRDLEISGCPIDTPKRKDLLKTALNGFGAKITDEKSISILSDYSNFAISKHNILQSILTVNDLFFTSQPLVANLFIEDVQKWLDSNEIRYVPNLKFTGRTGYNYAFHFAIPGSKSAPERILQAVNTPTKASVEHLVLAWVDTKDERPENSQAYAILNDQESTISMGVHEALESYGIMPVPWKDRHGIVRDIAA